MFIAKTTRSVALVTVCLLLAGLMLSGFLSLEATAQGRPSRWVVKPDPSLVNTLHEKLMERDGSLQDLFQMTAQTLSPEGASLPAGTSFVRLEDVPLSYPKISVESSEIIKDVSHINPRYHENYDQYVMFVPENKIPFYLFIQKSVSEARSIRSREILDWFLTDVEGSEYGDDKTEVANKIGENGGVILLLTGAHRDPNNLPGNQKPGQELYEAETPVPGDEWYMTQVREHRDAGFEEILHLVHDAGIGATSDRRSAYLPPASGFL